MSDESAVMTSANVNSELNSKQTELEKSWEKKLIDESLKPDDLNADGAIEKILFFFQ